MNRHIILFIISISIIITVASYDINFFNYEAPIPYSELSEITWENFRGKNKPYITMDGIKEFAFITTQIKASYTPDHKIIITAYFHPSRSYVYNKNVMDAATLKHELYHFHITEIISRKMRKRISNFPENHSFNLSEMLYVYRQSEDSLQHAYDDETYHSYLLGKQIAWQNKIDSTLLSLEEFSNPIVKK